MLTHQVKDIRNIALVGHGGAGKTTIADALLFQAHAVNRLGSVDEKTSVADFDDESQRRHFSVDSSILHLEHRGKFFHLLDTPGYGDFIGAALGAIAAVETVVVVISAVHGIEANTLRMFQEAGKRSLARMIVINKMDHETLEFEDLLSRIQNTLGKKCFLLNAPIQPGPSFRGVVSILRPSIGRIVGCPVDLVAARKSLTEAVVESDESLLIKYLNEGKITQEELMAALPRAMASGDVIPVLCTAAKKAVGMEELLDCLADLAPSPILGMKCVASRGSGMNPEKVVLKPDPREELVGQVFKTVHDRFVGNLSFVRIFSGHYRADHHTLYNLTTGKPSRPGAVLQIQGKSQHPVQEAVAGDIVAIAKIDDLHVGDTISDRADAPRLEPLHFPTPMFGIAIEPKARGDEQKISGSLNQIAGEDPTFHIHRDAQTHEWIMEGMSQLHLEVIQARIKRRFDLEMITHDPKVPYRETSMTTGEGTYRHKKQSGGRGQFAEVYLRVHPLSHSIKNVDDFFQQFATKARFEKIRLEHCHYDPDFNFGFIDTVVGGSIPNQFISACEKGCRDLLDRGALTGHRMQDIAVEIFFGKDHPVDSSEAAFKTATRLAFRNGYLNSHPVILEPVMRLEITFPGKFTGAVLADLNTRRARIESQTASGNDLVVLQAFAPLGEVNRYATGLGSITQGQGLFTMEFDHHVQVPAQLQQHLVNQYRPRTADED